MQENCDDFLRTQYFFIETFPSICLATGITTPFVTTVFLCCVLWWPAGADRSDSFCTDVRVLEVLFKGNVVER